MPDDIRDVIAKLRQAFALEVQRREEMVLRHDIAHLLAAGHQRDFFEGWPLHLVVPYLFALYHKDN